MPSESQEDVLKMYVDSDALNLYGPAPLPCDRDIFVAAFVERQCRIGDKDVSQDISDVANAFASRMATFLLRSGNILFARSAAAGIEVALGGPDNREPLSPAVQLLYALEQHSLAIPESVTKEFPDFDGFWQRFTARPPEARSLNAFFYAVEDDGTGLRFVPTPWH